jgi:hypothetical protein
VPALPWPVSGRIAVTPVADLAPDVPQRAILFEEDAGDPHGKRYDGSAAWRAAKISPGDGVSPVLTAHADVKIPARQIVMSWELRRNADRSLPVSHTIEIIFHLPPDFPGISAVPGILVSATAGARGTPLLGLSVKVTSDFFLVGLSVVEPDVQRNLSLLSEGGWIDIPIVYADGRRAILSVQEGDIGHHALAEAFAESDK